MLNTGQHGGWHKPEQPRFITFDDPEPLVIYDLTKRQGSPFFSYFGKAAFIVLVALTLYLAINWAWHNFPSDAVAAESAAENLPASDFVVSPSVEAAQLQPPKLGYVVSWSITASEATVTWSTDKASTSALAYGTTKSLGEMTAKQTKLEVTHGVKLSGLKSGTTYYYVAQSADKDGTIGYSSIYSFTTLAVGSGPTISDIVVVPQKNNQVQISWKTSIPSYNFVQLGPTTAYNRWSTRTNLTAEPHPSIAWVPSGTVHYQLVSTDAKGNKTTSPDYTFVEP